MEEHRHEDTDDAQVEQPTTPEPAEAPAEEPAQEPLPAAATPAADVTPPGSEPRPAEEQ